MQPLCQPYPTYVYSLDSPQITLFSAPTSALLAIVTTSADKMSNNADPGSVGWVNEPVTRGTMSLVYNSLSTMFICTWSAVHLNVPSDGDSQIIRKIRKVRWMILAVLAPEYVTTNAFRDWSLAREWTRDLKQWENRRYDKVRRFGPSWRIAHGIAREDTNTDDSIGLCTTAARIDAIDTTRRSVMTLPA